MKYPHFADRASRQPDFLRATMMQPNTKAPPEAHTCDQTNGFVDASKMIFAAITSLNCYQTAVHCGYSSGNRRPLTLKNSSAVIPSEARDLLFAATRQEQIPRANPALGMTGRCFVQPASSVLSQWFVPYVLVARPVPRRCAARIAQCSPGFDRRSWSTRRASDSPDAPR